MKLLHRITGRTAIEAIQGRLSCAQDVKFSGEEFVSKLLHRRWTLPHPDTRIDKVTFSGTKVQLGVASAGHISTLKVISRDSGLVMEENNQGPSFYVVRDDLLHPLINGNKARKLDCLLPLLEDHSVTDVVTCGGCQSAHAAATAVLCAERGTKSHLLLRGEQPDILTGYNLMSAIYGNVTYVRRNIYADREKMLKDHACLVAGSSGHVLWFDNIFVGSFADQSSSASKLVHPDSHRSVEDHARNVIIINEGAGDAVALLGLIRLVVYLSQDHLLGKKRALKLVIDAGTGTTAVGLGLGALILGLPWEVTAVMLADTIDGYRRQEKRLISEFQRHFGFSLIDHGLEESEAGGIVRWVERCRPRKFGNVLEGEVEACRQIAQRTGILIDPIYTLAAWEMSSLLCHEETVTDADTNTVMLHTGGTLGMFGLAQRYKSYFHNLKDEPSL